MLFHGISHVHVQCKLYMTVPDGLEMLSLSFTILARPKLVLFCTVAAAPVVNHRNNSISNMKRYKKDELIQKI